jgi:hypothetical protein
LRIFFTRREQTLELSNSVVRDVNHTVIKYGCSVIKSKLRLSPAQPKGLSSRAAQTARDLTNEIWNAQAK